MASVYAHVSHGKNRHKLCCSLLKLGSPMWFSLSFCFYSPFLLWVLIFCPEQWRGHLIRLIKLWHPPEWSISVPPVFSFSSLGNYIFGSPLFFQSHFLYRPSIPSSFSRHSLYIFPIWFLPIPKGLLQVLYLHKAFLICPAYSSDCSPKSFNICNSFALIIHCLILVFSDYMHLSHSSSQ